MINIDSVYQTVLALANKEQRGYITPQEFNLLANQAQTEIFEQYFYDIDQLKRRLDDNYEYGSLDVLYEKISAFEVEQNNVLTANTGSDSQVIDLSNYEIYKFGSIYIDGYEAERLTSKQFSLAKRSPLTRSTRERPCYQFFSGSGFGLKGPVIKFEGGSIYSSIPNITITYIRSPKKVSWGYVIVANKALYDPDPNKTQGFEINASDKVELVYKILKLAGVTIQREDIVAAGQAFESSQIQQEKL